MNTFLMNHPSPYTHTETSYMNNDSPLMSGYLGAKAHGPLLKFPLLRLQFT